MHYGSIGTVVTITCPCGKPFQATVRRGLMPTYCATCRTARRKASCDRQNHKQIAKRKADPAARDKWNAYMRQFRQTHPEVSARLVAKRRADPNHRAYDQAYNRAHLHTPEMRQHIRNARFRRRAAHKLNGKWLLSAADWQRALDAFHGCCAYCGAQPPQLTQDHFIPLSKGGTTTLGNIVPACAHCNSAKRAKLPQDFLAPKTYHSVVKVLAKLSSGFGSE